MTACVGMEDGKPFVFIIDEWDAMIREAQNDPDAQVLLGNCYYYGTGFNQNYLEALKWYRKASKQENGQAYYMIGRCYENGQGVKKSIQLAKENYQEEQIDRIAHAMWDAGQKMILITRMNREAADLFNKDIPFEYFEDAHIHGFKMATLKVAECYYLGKGVVQDKDYSFELAKKLYDEGYEEAQEFLQKYF